MSNLKPNFTYIPKILLDKIDKYSKRTGKKKQKIMEEALEMWIKHNIGD